MNKNPIIMEIRSDRPCVSGCPKNQGPVMEKILEVWHREQMKEYKKMKVLRSNVTMDGQTGEIVTESRVVFYDEEEDIKDIQ